MRDFIKNLKVGDQVAYSASFSQFYSVGTVSKITPTGRIYLDNGKKFNNGGHELGAAGRWSSASLYELTDKIKDKAVKQQLLQRIDRSELNKLSNDDLKKIVDIIDSSCPRSA